MKYIQHLFQQMENYFNIKVLASVAIVAFAYMFDATKIPVYIALFLLIIGDSIAGIGASIHGGGKVESAKLRRTAVKFVIYFGMVGAGHIAEYGLLPAMGVLDESIAGYLIATELLSILENVGRMGYVVPIRVIALLQKYVAKDEKDLTR